MKHICPSKVHDVNRNKKSTYIFIEEQNDWCVNKKQRKYIDSYDRKEKNDWCAHCKVHRFLQYRRKKMIDVHTVNQKKQRKYIDSYNTEEKNDWCAYCKQKKKKAKKVHRFLHACCKQKKQRFNQPITSTPHLICFLFSAWFLRT